MTILAEQLAKKLTKGMSLPKPFELLYSWIENNGLYVDTEDRRVGFLYPDEKMRSAWTETERPGGTIIEFTAIGNEDLSDWFGHDRSDILDRLCVFALTGAEGSMAAFWLDDDGQQRIVHLGSGSGSLLTCVLAEQAVDFLRLLAVGYDEICWISASSKSPNADIGKGGLFIHPNLEYQEWVKNTFSVNIPKNALEIVKNPSDMGDDDSPDPFCQWVEKSLA
jgi:hypothetical protein